VLYDLSNKFAIDGFLSALSTGEGTLALNHPTFSKTGDLIIYDRGYPSFDLIYEHFQRGIDFPIRVKIDFSNVTRKSYRSGLNSDTVKIYPGKNTNFSDKAYSKDTFKQVRLIRVELPSGEVEIRMSSLFDMKKWPDSIFKELYFLRWGIETFYDEPKDKIKVEYFSGYSPHSILQDFYAALFVSNVQSLLIGEINDESAEKSTGNKYQYKVNGNLSYGFLKNGIITLFFRNKEMHVIVSEPKELFKKHTDRSNTTKQETGQKYG
jgi:hypothetical protein